MDKIQVSEQFVTVSDGQVYLKRWRPTLVVGNPIILFHDSIGSVQMWRNFPEQLAERLNREVIAYDRLGFAKSSARTDLPSNRFINEEAEKYFPQIVDSLKLENFLLFGHSVGGAMALICANLFAYRCELVVTESAQAFVEERTKHGIMKASKDFENAELFSRLAKYHGEKAKWVLDAWVKVWLSPEFSSWTLSKDIKSVQCPVLIIHGDGDEFGSEAFPAAIAESVKGHVQKEILENCGHVPHREKPELVLSMVELFIGSHL